MQDANAVVPQRNVYSAMFVAITMMTAVLWMPSTLGALARGYGLGAPALSELAFAELPDFLLSTLFTNNKTLQELNTWVFSGCAVARGRQYLACCA